MFVQLAMSFSVSGTVHEHSYNELYTVKPTCTEKGYTVFACGCGEAYSGDEKEKLGHNFADETVCYKAPTCIEKGEQGRYCKRCYAKTDVTFINKTAHTPIYVTVKASMKRDGEIRKECSFCKKLYSRKIVNKVSSVKLKESVYTYDGKIKTPSVAVTDSSGMKLVKDKDYILKYSSGRKKTGIYSVRVIFKGNYNGEKTLSFRIRPTKVKNAEAVPSISSVYLSWDKAKGADGYEVYMSSGKLKLLTDTENLSYTVRKADGKKLKSGTDYVFVIKAYKKVGDKKVYSAKKTVKASTRPQKASVKKTSVSGGKAKITVTKQSCHGYELLISTNKSFSNPKSVVLKGKNSNTYTFDKTASGKTYYVKVRAYVISGGEKYYGYYSNVKTFRR